MLYKISIFTAILSASHIQGGVVAAQLRGVDLVHGSVAELNTLPRNHGACELAEGGAVGEAPDQIERKGHVQCHRQGQDNLNLPFDGPEANRTRQKHHPGGRLQGVQQRLGGEHGIAIAGVEIDHLRDGVQRPVAEGLLEADLEEEAHTCHDDRPGRGDLRGSVRGGGAPCSTERHGSAEPGRDRATRRGAPRRRPGCHRCAAGAALWASSA
mmetsp:Transcript_22479/g.77027  ORF Transcript_22479/g.77027 Transcript_22479/m.77027 type:complete len:212 (+) Transcript_22479:890-1525(+)